MISYRAGKSLNNNYKMVSDSNLNEILNIFWTDSWINSHIDLILNPWINLTLNQFPNKMLNEFLKWFSINGKIYFESISKQFLTKGQNNCLV